MIRVTGLPCRFGSSYNRFSLLQHLGKLPQECKVPGRVQLVEGLTEGLELRHWKP